MTTQIEFAKFMNELKKVLPKYAPTIDEDTIRAWYAALKDIELGGLRDIFVYCRDNLDAFPSIRLIKELVDYGSDEFPPDPFAELIAAVQSRNFTRHPTILETARQCGGWDAIGEWKIDAYDHKRRQVLEIWRGVVARFRAANILQENHNQLPPAETMKAILEGPKTNETPIKSNNKSPFKELINDIRGTQKSDKKRR